MDSGTKNQALLARLADTLAVLRSQIDAELPVQTVQVLVAIALHPASSPSEIATSTGLSPSSTTRHIQTLSTGRPGRTGLGLVSVLTEASDRRQRRLQLTRRGKTVVRRLTSTLSSTD